MTIRFMARAFPLSSADLYQRLADVARRDPKRVVVVDATTMLSYGDLLTAIDAQAAGLLDSCNPGDRVGVLLECSAATVVTYYACLRAGVLYTPLPASPDHQVSRLAARLGLAVLVTERGIDFAFKRPREPAPVPGARSFPEIDPAAPAHVLLTSGSTGAPKAVVTDQTGSILSHDWRSALCPFETGDAVGCNIFGIWDVVPALEHGVPVVMIDDASVRDPLALAGMITRHRITRMMLTPSLLAACLASPAALDAMKRLRLLVTCGEIAKPAVLRQTERHLPGTRLLNLYSIAECHDVAAGFVHGGESRLRPAPFAEVSVVDRDDRERPASAGEVGRVLVGGPGVALGYLEQDSARFFERDGSRCYDTGDLGIRHLDDELSIVGRADSRVKVRGRWVDSTEVENVLAGHPDVVDVTVVVAENRVRASVVGRGSDIRRRLRAYAREALPSHAVPDRIDLVGSLDIARSGKAERRETPRRQRRLEGAVVDAFRAVLDDATIGPDDDFTDVGGTSLDAIRLCGRLQEVTRRPVSVAELYRSRRPRALADRIERLARVAADDWDLVVEVPPVRRSSGLSPFRRPLVTGASSHLGRTVMAALGNRGVPLKRPEMDLDQPLLGLSKQAFEALAGEIDGVIHIAARVDPFADFASLRRTNVCGTAELIRLAGIRGVPFCHVSSSAVFPLGSQRIWTPDDEPSPVLSEPLRESGADAYSYTKLGAEILVWQAAEHGLPVRIVRIPHLLGSPERDRLGRTLVALRAAGVQPEGAWRWQFVTADPVAQALVDPFVRRPEIRHVALPPVAVHDLLRHLGLSLYPVPMAAIATALARVDTAHQQHVDAEVLLQLLAEHGPAAALSLNDAILEDCGGESLTAFAGACRVLLQPDQQ